MFCFILYWWWMLCVMCVVHKLFYRGSVLCYMGEPIGKIFGQLELTETGETCICVAGWFSPPGNPAPLWYSPPGTAPLWCSPPGTAPLWRTPPPKPWEPAQAPCNIPLLAMSQLLIGGRCLWDGDQVAGLEPCHVGEGAAGILDCARQKTEWGGFHQLLSNFNRLAFLKITGK
jgi:hypothetical protein